MAAATQFLILARWWEDGSATVFARAVARDGTGTQQDDGQKLLKAADLASVTLRVFDRSSSTPDTAVYSPSLTVSDVIFDTPLTDWGQSGSYNFRANIPASVFTTGGSVYRVEVKFTTTGGAVGYAKFEGRAEPIAMS